MASVLVLLECSCITPLYSFLLYRKVNPLHAMHATLLQSCSTFCDSIDYRPPGSSLHGILQARILELVAMPSSRGIFPTQGSNPGFLHCRHIFYHLSHQESSRNSQGTISKPRQPGCSLYYTFLHSDASTHNFISQCISTLASRGYNLRALKQ